MKKNTKEKKAPKRKKAVLKVRAEEQRKAPLHVYQHNQTDLDF